jgi:foldase protein PrsA
VKDFTKRWKEKTECSDGYKTTDCKNGPKATPTPTAPTDGTAPAPEEG